MLIKCLYVCIAPLNHADVSIPIVLRRDSCEDKRRNPHAPPRVATRGYAWLCVAMRGEWAVYESMADSMHYK